MTMPLHLHGPRLWTAVGGDPSALWAATQTGMGTQQFSDHLAALIAGANHSQGRMRVSPALEDIPDGRDRVRRVLEQALQTPLPADCTVLWPCRPDTLEHPWLAPERIWDWMGRTGLRHHRARLRIEVQDGSAVALMDRALEALQEQPAQHWMLGCVDSLLIPEVLSTLAAEGPGPAWDEDDGLVPGEAAIFMSVSLSGTGPHIRAWDACPEPRHADPSGGEYLAWAMALQGSLDQAGLDAFDLDGVVLPGNPGWDAAMEWYGCHARIWPLRDGDTPTLADTHPPAMDLRGVLGDAGAAGYLLQLALGMGWMEGSRRLAARGCGRGPRTVAILDRPLAAERGTAILEMAEPDPLHGRPES
ncbi:hypothetical protein ECTPHS_00859 [Ectothiorhodospira sp. PHS-1]|uniref:hypothetical protein n=1 Tax=Ectothiorhodospira sp. PHS-1 TaxID=519989 RepID=UPI00024A86A4|nr:hypothetical protein [Ectothiorhodospira sp. PHS-1]EHQ51206.1 hypothetical protein ECTPHS_00859 [Ectothiorhodospira sp. PHS-1]